MVLHSVFTVWSLSLQSFKCVRVEKGHTLCAHTKLTFCLHHTRHTCTVFTVLWCGCSVVKLTFYLHQTPFWLWLVWTDSPAFTPPGYRPVGTTVTNYAWTLLYYGHTSSPQTPDSTVTKVLTVLKWHMITTLNRKLLVKQRVQNRFASYEVHIRTVFLRSDTMATIFFAVHFSMATTRGRGKLATMTEIGTHG